MTDLIKFKEMPYARPDICAAEQKLTELTAALENPEHRGWVRGVSGKISWGKGFGEEYARMYRKKRKRPDDAFRQDLVKESWNSRSHPSTINQGSISSLNY